MHCSNLSWLRKIHHSFLHIFDLLNKLFNFYSVRHCPELTKPEYSVVNCTTTDSSYQTICNISCKEGFAIKGSASRNCQANMQWDGTETSCEGMELICSNTRKYFEMTKQNASTDKIILMMFDLDQQILLTCLFLEIRCSSPSSPIGGTISSNCILLSSNTLPYGETCHLACPNGFALSTLQQTVCIDKNTWSIDTSTAKCIGINY